MSDESHWMPAWEAMEIAAGMLKDAGFVLHWQSMRTESRYFKLPDRQATLRLGMHQSRKQPIGLGFVASKLTIPSNGCLTRPGMCKITREGIEGRVAQAIGYYFLRSINPPPSNYKGKRGTWENGARQSGLRA